MFTKILDRLRREPVLLTMAGALMVSGLAAFGLELSREQSAWVTALVVFVGAVVGRSQVTPTVNVAAKEQEPGAPLEAGPAADVKTGDAVDVTPAADPLETTVDPEYDGFGAPITDQT